MVHISIRVDTTMCTCKSKRSCHLRARPLLQRELRQSQVSVHHLHREILCVLGKERHLILAEIIGNDLELGG